MEPWDKTPEEDSGDSVAGPHLSQGSLLGDLGPNTASPPNLPHRVVVRVRWRLGDSLLCDALSSWEEAQVSEREPSQEDTIQLCFPLFPGQSHKLPMEHKWAFSVEFCGCDRTTGITANELKLQARRDS